MMPWRLNAAARDCTHANAAVRSSSSVPVIQIVHAGQDLGTLAVSALLP